MEWPSSPEPNVRVEKRRVGIRDLSRLQFRGQNDLGADFEADDLVEGAARRRVVRSVDVKQLMKDQRLELSLIFVDPSLGKHDCGAATIGGPAFLEPGRRQQQHCGREAEIQPRRLEAKGLEDGSQPRLLRRAPVPRLSRREAEVLGLRDVFVRLEACGPVERAHRLDEGVARREHSSARRRVAKLDHRSGSNLDSAPGRRRQSGPSDKSKRQEPGSHPFILPSSAPAARPPGWRRHSAHEQPGSGRESM